MHKQILTGGMETLVSNEDKDLFDHYTWRLLKAKQHPIGYAIRTGSKSFERNKAVLLHRVIIERMIGQPIPKGKQVHHINHNTLDNRRENLTITTPAENNFQRKGPTNLNQLKTLNICVVSPRVNAINPYLVQVQKNGIKKQGYAPSLKAAIEMRDQFRKELSEE